MSKIYLTRLVIETTSPMAISSGGRESGFDTELARDANGLPYIPATSIAGVWRSLVRQISEKEAAFWFGDKGRGSRLVISNGFIHDSGNKPVIGLHTQASLMKDALLKHLLQTRPHHREHVRINDRGVAADEAKFDQLMLPTGVRFCIDIKWQNEHAGMADEHLVKSWTTILKCWCHRLFVLGATTRNGLGRFKIVGDMQAELELLNNPDISGQLRSFARYEYIPTKPSLKAKEPEQPFASLPLVALDHWRCGSGTELLGAAPADGNSVGIISYAEKTITWTDHKAAFAKTMTPILCGSSIKGILAHRVSYHLRRLTKQWACDDSKWDEAPAELRELFGHADENKHENSVAGRLYVDDSIIENSITNIRRHNNIDRFTGGVRKGALYSEELLYQPKFTIKLWLAPQTKLSDNVKAALKMTLSDLEKGLLPMGAGSGRGTSMVMKNDDQNWTVNERQLEVVEQ